MSVRTEDGEMKHVTDIEWKRQGNTVYALTPYRGERRRGGPDMVNCFSAQVFGRGPEGISDEEAEEVARLMQAAPQMIGLLRKAHRALDDDEHAGHRRDLRDEIGDFLAPFYHPPIHTMVPKNISKEDFVALALKILGDADHYEDDLIKITRDRDYDELEIVRKPIPDRASHLLSENPTTVMLKGKIIRHHGDHAYIAPHMEELAAAIDTAQGAN